MIYQEILKKQIGKECTFTSNQTQCMINYGAAEPFASEGIIEDVTDHYCHYKKSGRNDDLSSRKYRNILLIKKTMKRELSEYKPSDRKDDLFHN